MQIEKEARVAGEKSRVAAILIKEKDKAKKKAK